MPSTLAMPFVTVKKKHQITIPHDLRKQMPIGEGDILEVTVQNGSYVFTPKNLVDREAEHKTEDWKKSFRAAAGMWADREDLDTFVEDIRREADERLERLFPDTES